MMGLDTKEFKEYRTPKIGLKARSIILPLKKSKKYGFIDEAIDIAKRTPASNKYGGHEEWKTNIRLLKFSETKR